MVIAIPSPSGPDSPHLPWETGILAYLFVFQMGSVTFWRGPPFSVDYTETPKGSQSYHKHLALMPQVTQGESKSLRTSTVLNERQPGSKVCITGSPAAISKFIPWSCLSALPVSSNQTSLLNTSQHGHEPGSAPEPQGQQPVLCSPSFIKGDTATVSTQRLKVTRSICSCKNSPSFPLKGIIKRFQEI